MTMVFSSAYLVSGISLPCNDKRQRSGTTPKKSQTKRPSTRSTRQTGRSRSNKTQQRRQKQSESQMHRSEGNTNMEEE